jgi:hypothetical protein
MAKNASKGSVIVTFLSPSSTYNKNSQPPNSTAVVGFLFGRNSGINKRLPLALSRAWARITAYLIRHLTRAHSVVSRRPTVTSVLRRCSEFAASVGTRNDRHGSRLGVATPTCAQGCKSTSLRAPDSNKGLRSYVLLAAARRLDSLLGQKAAQVYVHDRSSGRSRECGQGRTSGRRTDPAYFFSSKSAAISQ